MMLNNYAILDLHGVPLRAIETKKDYNELYDIPENEVEALAKLFWEIGWGTPFKFDSVFDLFHSLFMKSDNKKKYKALHIQEGEVIDRSYRNLACMIYADWYKTPNVKRKISIYCSTWPAETWLAFKYIKNGNRYVRRWRDKEAKELYYGKYGKLQG